MITRKQRLLEQCSQRVAWSDLDEAYLGKLLQLAKDEDLQGAGLTGGAALPGDHSSALLDPASRAAAVLRARESMTVCGLPLGTQVAQLYGDELRFTAAVEDGSRVTKGQAIGTLQGPTQAALSAERPLLNFLQRLSGIATLTAACVDAMGDSSTRLLDTRKTTPGFRVLEKYAVACGGGWNHRMGLFDRVMLKDNHLAAFGDDPAGAANAAVSESRRRAPQLLVEMEVDTLQQIEIALAAEVDIILLDNFSAQELREAVDRIGEQAVTEASGGITIESLPELARLGLDFISTGAVVHQSRWVDIGLDWE